MKSIKIIVPLLLVLFTGFSGFSQADSKTKEKSPGEKIKLFWFVMIKTGSKTDFDSATKAKLFEGHMANMKRLYDDGILKIAGPFGKNDLTWRGIFVFDCETREEAERIVATDPAISANLFAVDIVPWYAEPIGSLKKGKPGKSDN